MIIDAILDELNDPEHTADVHRSKPHGLGWTFTEDEERRIKKACKGAVAYMRNYGKGKRTQMIDLKHYAYKWTEEELQALQEEKNCKKNGKN